MADALCSDSKRCLLSGSEEGSQCITTLTTKYYDRISYMARGPYLLLLVHQGCMEQETGGHTYKSPFDYRTSLVQLDRICSVLLYYQG